MDMDDAQRRALIHIYRERLDVLERQLAALGDAYAPPHLITEIEDIRRKLAVYTTYADAPNPDIHPLRMLALIATPLVQHAAKGLQPIAPLAVQEELSVIANACEQTSRPAAIEIHVAIASAAVMGQVFAADNLSFDILHFNGRGSVDDPSVALMIEDDDGQGVARPMAIADLRSLLGSRPCHLALLSAGHTEALAGALLDLGVPHVITINADDTVLDAAARGFVRRFYPALIAGRSVAEAFERAVVAMEHDARSVTYDPNAPRPAGTSVPFRFGLLPQGDLAHQQPLIANPPPGKVRLIEAGWERTNTLASADPFIGRRHELHEIARKLNDNDRRCLAIYGPGGMGKTALAEAAGRWQHERARWPDGVWLIELRNISEVAAARLLIVTTLKTLNLDSETIASDTALAGALRNRRALLILDDLDTLRTTDRNGLVGLLTALLRVPSLRLLVTARDFLPGTVNLQKIELGRLSSDDALAAFKKYAPPLEVWGRWQPDDLQALMDSLDGYPFPIRLAATYMDRTHCGLRELRQRLEINPDSTLRYPDDEADRTTSLAATLDLSYRGLPPDAKELLPLLALFPAGLSREGARTILGDASEDVLERLVRHSMAEYRDEIVYQRFVLPEPARRYAEAHQRSDVMERYAPAALKFYHGLVQKCDANLMRETMREGRLVLTLELPNLRRFLDWGYDHEQSRNGPCLSAQTTALLDNFWTITGVKKQAREDIEQRLKRALAAAQRTNDRIGQAEVHRVIGGVYFFCKEMSLALQSYNQAIELYTGLLSELSQIGDDKLGKTLKQYRKRISLGEANVRKAIGDVQQFRGQMDPALWSYSLALAQYRAVGTKLNEANVHLMIGGVYKFHKWMEEALSSYRQALALYKVRGHQLGEANALQAIGTVYQLDKRMDQALDQYQQALALYRELEYQLGEANTRKGLGDVLFFRRQTLEALDQYQQALDLYRAMSKRLGEASTLKAIGDVRLFLDEYDAARHSYERALTLYRAVSDRLGEANVLAAQGQLPLITGDQSAAETLLHQAITICLGIGNRYIIPAMIGNYGWALRRIKAFDRAGPYLRQAADLFDAMGFHADGQRHRTAATAPIATDLLDFEPLLQAIAKIACGESTRRSEIEKLLSDLELSGYHLSPAISAIWQGQHDPITLTAGLDEFDTRIVLRVLEILEHIPTADDPSSNKKQR